MKIEKNMLKMAVCSEIDRHKDELIELGREIWENPELGYQEFNTAKLVQKKFAEIGLPFRKDIAVTGVRADWSADNPGPKVAVLGELDALYTPEHPECNKETGAVHACGHNGQICAMIGTAFAMNLPEVKQALSGSAAFIAVPAEEGRMASLESGMRFVSGKAQMIFDGVFDDIDMAMMTHGALKYGIAISANGIVMKNVRFIGKGCHAGVPWEGTNALSAARLALSAIDSQRETFKDTDTVRFHGFIKNGGTVVNNVPSEVELEYMVRAQTPATMQKASELFDRCMKGAAIAFGVDVEIDSHHGCMPLENDRNFAEIHYKNLMSEIPGAEFHDLGRRTSSTDFGDVAMLMPGIHPYCCGWGGELHTVTAHCADGYKAYVEPAKIMAMNLVDLLYDDAAKAKEIISKNKRYTKEEYCRMVESFDHKEYFSGK